MEIPLGLYIHLPWCERRCPYCDFNAHALRGQLPEADYLDALCADLRLEADRAAGRRVDSIFIGGGTPSLFSAAAIGRSLDEAARTLTLAADCEITLEANPGSAEAARFRGYHAAGVNRLSLGIQSFDDASLVRLGRIHDRAAALRAIESARAAGFERLNLDLMHGLPGQDVEHAHADLVQALAQSPGHISHYQLTLEPNTPFYRDPPELPGEDTLADIQDDCESLLEATGYLRYEISAWSLPGQESRHNLNYWRYGDYLGIGAGAHGKLTGADGRIVRRIRHRHPQAYLAAAADGRFIRAESQPDDAERAFEYMLNALRLREGFTEAAFVERTGLPVERIRPVLVRAARRGLLEQPAEHAWRPTGRGQRYLNDLQAMFLPGT